MKGELHGLTTRILGSHVVYLPTVDSTNTYLKENGDSLPHGTVCYTGWQQAGRGRLGRPWCVKEGQTLAMSVLFKSDTDMTMLPLISGMATVQALRLLSGGEYLIKWPNDIVCGGHKVCGILCENKWEQNNSFTIAGIGVNLKQSAEDFLLMKLPYAASVKMVTGCDIDAEDIASAIINAMEPLWLQLQESGFPALREFYEDICATIGCCVRVLSPDGFVLQEGKAVGIADNGCLIIECGGQRLNVNAGEVSVRGLEGYV